MHQERNLISSIIKYIQEYTGGNPLYKAIPVNVVSGGGGGGGGSSTSPTDISTGVDLSIRPAPITVPVGVGTTVLNITLPKNGYYLARVEGNMNGYITVKNGGQPLDLYTTLKTDVIDSTYRDYYLFSKTSLTVEVFNNTTSSNLVFYLVSSLPEQYSTKLGVQLTANSSSLYSTLGYSYLEIDNVNYDITEFDNSGNILTNPEKYRGSVHFRGVVFRLTNTTNSVQTYSLKLSNCPNQANTNQLISSTQSNTGIVPATNTRVLIAGTDSGGLTQTPMVSNTGQISVLEANSASINTGIGTTNTGISAVNQSIVNTQSNTGIVPATNTRVLIAGTDSGGLTQTPMVSNTGQISVLEANSASINTGITSLVKFSLTYPQLFRAFATTFSTFSVLTPVNTPILNSLYLRNNSTTETIFFQVHYKSVVLVVNDIPKLSFRVPPSSTAFIGSDFFSELGLAIIPFVSGGSIYFAQSSTEGVFTPSTSNITIQALVSDRVI